MKIIDKLEGFSWYFTEEFSAVRLRLDEECIRRTLFGDAKLHTL